MKRKELASYLLGLAFICAYILGVYELVTWINKPFVYILALLVTSAIWYWIESRIEKK